MNQNQRNGERRVPDWFENNRVDEGRFLRAMQNISNFRVVNGAFYDGGEHLISDAAMKRLITQELYPTLTTGLNKKASELLNFMRYQWLYDVQDTDPNIIHVANGTLNLAANEFTENKNFSIRRIQAPYMPNAPRPERFLEYLNQLLEPEDILTLQEYLGYCLIPSTKAQKMLVISGNGGEGKSVLGQVLGGIWGDSLLYSSIQKIATDRFARATLVERLVMVDDDMSLDALPQTHVLKTLITLTGRTDVEQKGVQSYQATLYARFIGFTNGTLSALYDRSYGFYRRLILLKTKDRPEGRSDNPDLAEAILFEDRAGILKWCLEGLDRLFCNNFKFTISKQAQKNLEEAIREADPIGDFLDSQGYIRFDPEGSVTSADLYETFKTYCQDNSVTAIGNQSFQKRVKGPLIRRNARYTSHVPCQRTRSIRGYIGLRLEKPVGWQ